MKRAQPLLHDGNGKVFAITDSATGENQRGDRDMKYDELNRLIEVKSPMYGSPPNRGTAEYTYDELDNLRTVSISGRPVAVTDEFQQLVTRFQYEPYGQVHDRIPYATPSDGPGYTGHLFDDVTGLNYMQQRYYDPGIGRFISADPVGADPNTGANFNRYWYANNNPYKFIDPDGRNCVSTDDKTKCEFELTGSRIPQSVTFQTPGNWAAAGSGGSNERQDNTFRSEKSALRYIQRNVEQPEGREDGGFIHKFGKRFWASRKVGGPQSVDIGQPPDGAVAAWHRQTDQGPGSEFFSYSPVSRLDGKVGPYYHFRDGDVAYAKHSNIRFYLIAPGDSLRVIDPADITAVHNPRAQDFSDMFRLRWKVQQ